MLCYICNCDIVGELKALVLHYKLIHLLKPDSLYTCLEDACSQTFNCLSSFKRHVNKKHAVVMSKTFPSLQSGNCVQETTNMAPSIEYSTRDSINNYDELKDPFNFGKSANELYESTLKFIISLYNNNNFNNSDVLYIQSGMTENILKPIASILKNMVKINISEPILVSTFNRLEGLIVNPFNYCSTEYHLNNWLISNNLLCKVQQITINNQMCPVSYSGEICYNEKVTKGALLPLQFQFKQFFEHDNNFKTSYDRLVNFQTDKTSFLNFVQGNLWKQKTSQYEGKIVFPYFLYIDDFEINNPLGSHATYQSIAAIYYSFPLIENNSKLSNIFLAALIKSTDFKEFGNDPCLLQIIDEINYLANEGIIITTEHGEFKVYFILGLILGDNLGLNSILEFSKSFSSNYYCRFCKTHKTIANKLCEEDGSSMRNANNYLKDVAEMNFSETGIYKNSILNSIKHFHVVENYCVDIMHDVFEGICHYDMCHIIKYYTNIAQIISLTTLNKQKTNFNYGPIEVGNISPEITEQHLNKCHLKMSAREMMTFVHFFSIMVGEFVPENDEVWQFYLTLVKIIDMLLSYKFTESKIEYLKQLIHQHNSMYIRLFNDTLKPKHHFLTHYPTIIRYAGPPRHYWCFRFEGKHKELKAYARATSSRKNITLTLAKKCQYKFAYILLQPINTLHIVLKQKHCISSLYSNTILTNISLTTSGKSVFQCYNQIEFMGTVYKGGYYLTKFIEEINLFEILELVVIDNPFLIIYVLVKQIKIENFNSHFESFEVDKDRTIVNNCLIFKIEEFSGPPINITPTSSGRLMIRLKEFF